MAIFLSRRGVARLPPQDSDKKKGSPKVQLPNKR